MNYSCAMPFKTFLLDQSGYCGPCCNNAGVYKLKNTLISHRWKGPEFSQLRDLHLRNQPASECKRCYIEEQSGYKSQRMIANQEIYPGFIPHQNSKYDGPEKLILRLSNICNFACQTCHSMDSSKYIQEGQFYATTYGDKKSRYVKQIETGELSESEMQNCFEISKNLKNIEFFGGEPMLNKTHYVLLQKLIESGQSQDIELFYSTNASVFPSEELLRIWKHFKRLRIQFSIDGIGKQFHYLRWPGDWNKVTDNINEYKALSLNLGIQVHLGVNLTVSNLNILDLENPTSWILSNFDSQHFLTLAHDPEYYCIRNIPEKYKTEVLKHYENSEFKIFYLPILQFMNSSESSPQAWRNFLSWVAKKDQYRNLNYFKYFPKMEEMLKLEQFEVICSTA